MLMLCGYSGENRAETAIEQAQKELNEVKRTHEQTLKQQEQGMASQYTQMLQQNASQYQMQTSQINQQLAAQTAMVVTLRSQLASKDAQFKDQIALVYQQGSSEMRSKMLEQARLREQQLLEDARHNEAVAYAKGLSEGAAVLHHKPMSTSPTSPGTFEPGPPPGITAPAPTQLEVASAVGVTGMATGVAILQTEQPTQPYGTTLSLPEPVDAAPTSGQYGATMVSEQSMDPRGTVVSTSSSQPAPTAASEGTSELYAPTIMPGESAAVGGTIMPSGGL